MKHLRYLVCLWVLIVSSLRIAAAENEKPNFIFILVDDMGWADLACYGEPYFETPNIDKLASQGMKFTQAYSACTVCSPTRASFLTGKYPATLKVTDWIAGHDKPNAKLVPPDWTLHLPKDEITIAQRLKSAGYATASIGKWHLGGPEFAPEKFGFDINIAGFHKGSPPSYFSPYNNPHLSDGPDGEYLTDRLTGEAIQFIEKNKTKPFFVYLPHYAVHTPIQAKKTVTEKYRNKPQPAGKKINPEYAALVESVDDSVGRLMTALDGLDLSRRTYIFFTSDNGGLARHTSNKPLRDGKGSVYEGGVRVPLIVRGPNIQQHTNDTPVITADFYSTILELAGLPHKEEHQVEGESLLPLLASNGKLKRTDLYWHYPHYHPGGATPYSAIRDGDFKLIQFYEDGAFELYNLKNDIGETQNLAVQMPAKVLELNRKLDLWRKATGAQSPLPNPRQHQL
ncbi:MAG: sulfatase [Verrucomicrobia bacterium]|jgi:arylsulfatase A-like enzyme|nr:sulfatase [Verrucomicrobiota bacterium]